MPQVIQTIPDDELRTDYWDSKTEAATIEKLAPWTDPQTKNPDYWRARLDRNKAIMRVTKAEARRRGLEL